MIIHLHKNFSGRNLLSDSTFTQGGSAVASPGWPGFSSDGFVLLSLVAVRGLGQTGLVSRAGWFQANRFGPQVCLRSGQVEEPQQFSQDIQPKFSKIFLNLSTMRENMLC